MAIANSLIPLTRRLMSRYRRSHDERLFGIVGRSSRPRLQPCLQVDPIDLLVGFRAPRSWNGVAVVSDGTARPLPASDGEPAPDAHRVVVAFAVDRSGQTASCVGDGSGYIQFSTEDEVSGFVADLCRRVLGLPCPDEPRGTIDLTTAEWLDTILHLAADPLTAPHVRTWPDAVALHPAVSPGADPAMFGDPLDLAAMTHRVTDEWDWEQLRLSAIRGDVVLDDVSPAAAEWMDGPFLARWLLGMHRPLHDLVDDLRLFLDHDLHEQVLDVVTACCNEW